MVRLVVAIGVVLVAAGVAELVRRRRQLDPPTQPVRQLPAQIDRADFADPGAPWLVAVFSSDSCSTCADVIAKAEVLRSNEIAVDVVSYQRRKDTHARYSIDAVPCLVLADAEGAVRGGFVGPVTAADLWSAVADARSSY